MTDPFSFADDLGPEAVVPLHHAGLGLRAIVAVDNTACGPAIGGVRMAADANAAEACRLARAITMKNAAACLPHGGGKAVIIADPRQPPAAKEALMRGFAQAIRSLDAYIPGPDMGTDETCMAWVHDEIGRAVGLPRVLGGIPLDEIGATGIGLAAAIEVAAERIGLTLHGARFAVQGFGAVGRHAARELTARGAVLVAASDSAGTIADPSGLDVGALSALKLAGAVLRDHGRGRKCAPDAILSVACDIWIPAARPDVIGAENVALLDTRLVAQGANIPCTPQAEAALHARGVLVLPDFIANAGGVICAAVEYAGGSETEVLTRIVERIRRNTTEVLDQAASSRTIPRAAAVALAKRHVRKATALRRFR